MAVQVRCPNPRCGATISSSGVTSTGHCPHCGQDLAASSVSNPASSPPPAQAAPLELAVGSMFGRYRIERRLGRGGMGSVYLAQDLMLDRRVAVKIPSLALQDGPEALERFYREARAAAALDHPNLCPVYDVGEVDGSPYLTMAYVDGRPLSDLIAQRDSWPLRQVAAVVRKLALAMQVAHDNGVIHRDLKPSNIVLSRRRELVVVDFGLARLVGGDDIRLTRTGVILGTPAYMAPEQVTCDLAAMGPGCDIYSLGVILYELLTGRLPFEGPMASVLGQIMVAQPQPPSRLRADSDPRLEAVCLKALAKKAGDRFASMAEMAAALTDYLRGGESPESPFSSGIELGGAASASADSRRTGGESLVGQLFIDAASQARPASESSTPPAPAPVTGSSGRQLGWPRRGWLAASAAALLLPLVALAFYVATDWGGAKRAARAAPEPNVVATDRESAKQATRDTPEPNVGPEESSPGPPEVKPALAEKPVEVKTITSTTGMKLVLVPAGEFDMGSSGEDKDAQDDEKPRHRVWITRPFYLGAYEVTQGEYAQVMGTNPSSFSAQGKLAKQVVGQSTDRFPVQNVSWNDAISFCNQLSERDGLRPYYLLGERADSGGDGYRLPTEAEWEYACRAGSTSRYSFGDEPAALHSFAWTGDNSGRDIWDSVRVRNVAGGNPSIFLVEMVNHGCRPHPVGEKRPNAFGLYDMYGNVREWCWDGYDKDYYAQSPVTDPAGPPQASVRVVRNGNWFYGPRESRSAFRWGRPPDTRDYGIGFRVARVQSDRGDAKRATRDTPEPNVGPEESSPRPPEVKPALAEKPDEVRTITSSIGMKLVLIPAGEFEMGSSDEDKDAQSDEKPRHRVRITRPFYLGAYEVTQAEYEQVMGTNPSDFSAGGDLASTVADLDTSRHPVEKVSWNDAIAFCNKLSERDGLKPYYQVGESVKLGKGDGYRLPTEAEWEYSCRAGATTRYSYGDDEASLDGYAWYESNAHGRTQPVGEKRPNGFGLYDMHGNVWEWCWDGYMSSFYKESTVADPSGPSQAKARVRRGGGWYVNPSLARSATRTLVAPVIRYNSLGFRVARVQSGQGGAKRATRAAPEPKLGPEESSLGRPEVKPARAEKSDEVKTITNSIGMKLVLIPAGEFEMGARDDDKEATDDETPRHHVRITRPFYLGVYEVTQGEYEKVVGTNPSDFPVGRGYRKDVAPVEDVNWSDAVAFCNKLSERDGLTPYYQSSSGAGSGGDGYRLPTEAEWEYACRAGSSTRNSFGDDAARLGEYAWYEDNAGHKPHAVGGKPPNAFGLYDMYGNVWEWCQDGFDFNYYGKSPDADPSGPSQATERVYRGGSWCDGPRHLRSAMRGRFRPDFRGGSVGFRVARVRAARPLTSTGGREPAARNSSSNTRSLRVHPGTRRN